MSDDRRGTSRPGQSFRDPAYGPIEARLEEKYNLPSGLLSRIRTRGERSNADQVSSAGARTVYQVIPSTRARFLSKYGVDAYASPEGAAEVAALHLRDSIRRGNTVAGAVSEYIGGPDRRNHGAVTNAYVGRVMGTAPAGDGQLAVHDTAPPEASSLDFLNSSTGDLAYARKPLGPQPRDPQASKEAKRIAALTAIVGPNGIPQAHDTPNTPVLTTEIAQDDAAKAAEAARVKRATPYGANRPLANSADRFAAAADEEWFLPQLARSIDAAHPEVQAGYTEFYAKNREDIESFAQSPREVEILRGTTSQADLAQAQKQIEHSRANWETMDATGHGTAFSLLAGLSDPAGWVAGGGVGKGFEVAGVGSRALMRAGRTGAAVASLSAESASANVAFTGLLDAAGRHTTSEDYAMAAGQGMLIGLALSPVALRGHADVYTPVDAQRVVDLAVQAKGERMAKAASNVGPDASPAQIAAEAERLDAHEQVQNFRGLLADIPPSERLLHSDPEQLLTANPTVREGVVSRYNLGTTMADDTERAMVTEHIARAEAILAQNPIDATALKTVLKAGGWESTGLRLLASESPVARAVGVQLLESTTGAAGRRRTAAMAMHTRQRLYNRVVYPFDDLYHAFRREQGVGMVSEFVNGRVRRQFNERVFDEVEARAETPEGQTFDTNVHVQQAADLWERGMNMMRKDMQHTDVVGAARLGLTSRGYISHKLDARKVMTLTTQQKGRVINELAAQFAGPENGFYVQAKDKLGNPIPGETTIKGYDKNFARKLAIKYMERAVDSAKGGYDVPMNLRSPEAAEIVRDALEAMNIPADEVEKMMGRYSRGGADFTKGRLKINMQADIGDGMKLRDLFNTDISGLYRSYARRVAGEVALAQYGVMGKKGLNVLRKALDASGASVDDMKAFDQIAAEFLNTPYGSHNHKFMDNTRLATSVARLGGMGFTQLAEYGNAIASLGVHRTFAAIGALPRMAREVTHLAKGGESANPVLKSLDLLGGDMGMDEYQLSRMFDVKDNDIQVYSTDNIGIGTRGLRAAAHIQASLTGQRMITAVQTRGMAEQIVRKAIGFIRDGKEDVALADMGITPELAAKIKGDLANTATFDGDKLGALDFTKSKLSGHDLVTFRDAIERGASQIIQRTYIGETGKWAHDGFLKLLAQFRTFGVTAVEKQWRRGVKNHGAIKSSMYLLGAMSFAVPIHMARVQAKMLGMSRAQREKYADENLSVGSVARASINYASASGLVGDVWDIGGGFASAFGGDGGQQLAQQIGVRGTKGQSQLLGGVVAPGVGLVEDVWDGVHGDGKKLVNLLPGANLPYTQPIITALSPEPSSASAHQ